MLRWAIRWANNIACWMYSNIQFIGNKGREAIPRKTYTTIDVFEYFSVYLEMCPSLTSYTQYKWKDSRNCSRLEIAASQSRLIKPINFVLQTTDIPYYDQTSFSWISGYWKEIMVKPDQKALGSPSVYFN